MGIETEVVCSHVAGSVLMSKGDDLPLVTIFRSQTEHG